MPTTRINPSSYRRAGGGSMAPIASGSPTCLGRSRDSCTRNLGRPWDKVHSELRHGLDVRKVTGRHIFDHLSKWSKLIAGLTPIARFTSARVVGVLNGFHVHPRSGLLCLVPSPSARARKKEGLL